MLLLPHSVRYMNVLAAAARSDAVATRRSVRYASTTSGFESRLERPSASRLSRSYLPAISLLH